MDVKIYKNRQKTMFPETIPSLVLFRISRFLGLHQPITSLKYEDMALNISLMEKMLCEKPTKIQTISKVHSKPCFKHQLIYHWKAQLFGFNFIVWANFVYIKTGIKCLIWFLTMTNLSSILVLYITMKISWS